MKKIFISRVIGAVFFMLWGAVIGMPSANASVSQSTNDASGESSFNTAGHWSDSLAPTSDKDYATSYQLRTPTDSANYTFGGNSLTLNNGGQLIFKGGAASTIQINNLIMVTGAKIINWTSYNFTLAGNISIASGQIGKLEISGTNVGFTVTSIISGAGGINFSRDVTTQTSYAVTLNATNTYSGGTTVSTYAYAIAASSGAFGSGNVTVSGGKLELQNSSTISDSANFILASTLSAGSIVLNYSGAEKVGALSLNGGSTYLSAGTYTVTDLNSYYSGTSVFSGAGTITVIPEPSSYALISLGVVAFLALKITKKSLCC